MRPLRLLLDGFGSYRQPAEADFSDVEFFALVGPTGSGKSTLIDGLCFALYGTVPRWGKENAIAQALAPAANACRVCLVFEAGGRRYAAVRALTRDKKGKVHTKEARLELLSPDVAPSAPAEDLLGASPDSASTVALAEGPDEVKARVQEILGLSYEHFTQSVLLPQGQFAEFLHAKPGDRQDLLVQLLAFGVYDAVGQRARERAKLAAAAEQTARRERNELAFATPEAVARLEERVARLTRLETEVAGRLRELDEARRAAAVNEQEVARLRPDVKLLADVAVPGSVPGLGRRIAAADSAVTEAARAAQATSDAEVAAEQAAQSLPDQSALEARLGRYRDRRELAAQLTEQDAAAGKATEAEQAASGALHAAEEALRDAGYALEQARDEHAAAHLAAGLSAGADCPVCLRPVLDADLARRPAPASLDAAETAVAKAERQVRTAQDAARKATRDAAAARGTAAATRDRFAHVAAQLAAPAIPPLEPDPADPAADLSAAEAVAGAVLARVEAADRELRAARAAAREARGVLDKAQRARDALTGEEEQAWTAFRRTRDALVALPPAPGGMPPAPGGMNGTLTTPGGAERHIHAAWSALALWAAERRDDAGRRLRELDGRGLALRREVTDAEAAIANMLAEAGLRDAGVPDPIHVTAILAAERTKAEGELERLRGQVQHAVLLDERIAAHREEEQVASMLGNLLRATAFERWLCGEALDALVAEASQTLMELSGGQYQLDRDDRNELVVIDYQDAGAKRPVHTLSGGETFQASLALALALSRQVVGLSAGLRDLNSMFLDEGFGTLDEDTLETVAATLERLAADSDRMVGVITHVPALAERVPVRFVVSREAGTSVIRKERAV